MSRRRRSVHVNIDDYDVEEQKRAMERILQEKKDREFAANLQRWENLGVQPPAPRARDLRPAVVTISDESEDDQEDEEEDSEDDSSDDEPEVNHIEQAFQDNDAEMYRRELRLYDTVELPTTSAAAVAAYRTPEREGVANAKWGDCPLCFEVPKNPQGCNGCMMLVGCNTCVTNWHKATEAPSCPLCRFKWVQRPLVSSMTIIERRKRTRDRDRTAEKTELVRVMKTPAASILSVSAPSSSTAGSSGPQRRRTCGRTRRAPREVGNLENIDENSAHL